MTSLGHPWGLVDRKVQSSGKFNTNSLFPLKTSWKNVKTHPTKKFQNFQIWTVNCKTWENPSCKPAATCQSGPTTYEYFTATSIPKFSKISDSFSTSIATKIKTFNSFFMNLIIVEYHSQKCDLSLITKMKSLLHLPFFKKNWQINNYEMK